MNQILTAVALSMWKLVG